MKRLFVLLLIVLAAGTWIGQKMVQDPGYVLIAYDHTTIETSLWVMLIVAFTGFFAAHWALNLAMRYAAPSQRLKAWQASRREKNAQRRTLRGLLALAEGNWPRAQRQLGQSAEQSPVPLINYIAAARAAHEQGEAAAADELLQKARSNTPSGEVAIGISQVQFQLARGELEPCLANLLKLRKLAPKNTYVMRLLKETYLQLKDWDALIQLIPELRKQQAMQEEAIAKLEAKVYSHLLDRSMETLPSSTDNASRHSILDKAWAKLPNKISSQPTMVQRYIDLLVSIGAEPKAELILKDVLNSKWSESLVLTYGLVKGKDAAKQLKTAETWQRDHVSSTNLMLTSGRLAQRCGEWEKAEKYLNQSLGMGSQEALVELHRTLRHNGKHEQANQVMQDNLHLLITDLPDFPEAKAS
ncbi:MAG: heme biosynthesis HemY N-terminal domain-containing protein [Pontibacterium sp.]